MKRILTIRAVAVWRPAIAAVLLAASPACAQESDSTVPTDLAEQTPEQIMAEAENIHPAALYVLASKLLSSGRPDEAVVWFYIGQLRYRFLIQTEPANVGDERILFSALSESVGRPINEYAFGDIPAAVAQIDEALAWDAAHPNGHTPKDEHPAQLAEVREGLQDLRDQMVARQEEIREVRTSNGLENR